MVDEVIDLDIQARKTQQEADTLRADRKRLSKQIGALMVQGRKEDAEATKSQVNAGAERLAELEELEGELQEKIKKIMMVIPNIIDPSVPIGKDDSENVEVQRYGEPVTPDFEIPYHAEIMERFQGLDLDSARKVAGNGFYYLMGDIARLHSAVISYARDFMINRGFTYCVPPFMIRSNVVTGVMSFAEMDAMMYKIEGEDLYLIGTSEHTVDLFRSLDVPVRTLECCSGDLADLKVKSIDVEAWSPRQQKYFEVGSCSNLGDAQARRLKIRVNAKGGKYFAHTLNNTVVAPPRMLIAFLENNLCEDGSVKIPEALRPYMGGQEKIVPPEK